MLLVGEHISVFTCVTLCEIYLFVEVKILSLLISIADLYTFAGAVGNYKSHHRADANMQYSTTDDANQRKQGSFESAVVLQYPIDNLSDSVLLMEQVVSYGCQSHPRPVLRKHWQNGGDAT